MADVNTALLEEKNQLAEDNKIYWHKLVALEEENRQLHAKINVLTTQNSKLRVGNLMAKPKSRPQRK